MAGRLCAAMQHSDQMACGPCQLTWDTNDEDAPRCPREPLTDQRTEPTIIGFDLAKPGSELTAMSWPPHQPPTLLEFIELVGYAPGLTPYQRKLVEMLDAGISRGNKIRRFSRR